MLQKAINPCGSKRGIKLYIVAVRRLLLLKSFDLLGYQITKSRNCEISQTTVPQRDLTDKYLSLELLESSILVYAITSVPTPFKLNEKIIG